MSSKTLLFSALVAASQLMGNGVYALPQDQGAATPSASGAPSATAPLAPGATTFDTSGLPTEPLATGLPDDYSIA